MVAPDLKSFTFVPQIVSYCETQFPRKCQACGTEYENFKAYCLMTQPIGDPVAYDEMKREKGPQHPIGLISQANCACGSTLSLNCADTQSENYHALIGAVRDDAAERQCSSGRIMSMIREKIRATVC